MKRRAKWFLLFAVVLGLAAVVYVCSRPLVFNESFWQHAHCIKIAGLQLQGYAAAHEGKFPCDPRGYPSALLLLDEDIYFALTGPGYDAAAFHEAKRTGRELTEEECGRVYIQGLTTKSNPALALLFDKLPTPGGDHCPFPVRLWAPLGREVWIVGGGHFFIREADWPEFASKQIALLVQEGWGVDKAQRLFATTVDVR